MARHRFASAAVVIVAGLWSGAAGAGGPAPTGITGWFDPQTGVFTPDGDTAASVGAPGQVGQTIKTDENGDAFIDVVPKLTFLGKPLPATSVSCDGTLQVLRPNGGVRTYYLSRLSGSVGARPGGWLEVPVRLESAEGKGILKWSLTCRIQSEPQREKTFGGIADTASIKPEILL